MKLWILIATGLLLALVHAHAGWMDKGRDLLNTLGGETSSELTGGEIANGLKEALRVGTANVTGQLGAVDGFNADPAIRIPLPKSLRTVQSALGRVGMSGMMDDLELKLNRAAEAATPKAKDLFLNAISAMTLDDARQIYNGPEDAATRYFEQKMSPELAEAFRPVVDQSLSEVGAVTAYDQAMGQYKALPFVPDVKADLNQYVVDQGMAGIFHYLAKEEAAIRQNPAARSTELLKKVFGR